MSGGRFFPFCDRPSSEAADVDRRARAGWLEPATLAPLIHRLGGDAGCENPRLATCPQCWDAGLVQPAASAEPLTPGMAGIHPIDGQPINHDIRLPPKRALSRRE